MMPLQLQQTEHHLSNPAFSSFLDFARWVAAFIVFAGHLRNPLFLGFADLGSEKTSLLINAWYFVTGLFGEAVIFFFVLSGYLIGGIGMAKHASGQFDLRKYAVDRATRLYAAFLPALLLTLVLGYVGARISPNPGLYDGSQVMFAKKLDGLDLTQLATARNFIGNLFMLQTFRFEAFGSNPPLWTISAEFWFYAFFGICIVVIQGGRSQIVRLFLFGLLVVIGVLLTLDFFYYLGLWLVGAFVAVVPASRFRHPLVFALLFVAVLLLCRLLHGQISELAFGLTIRDYAVAISFALLIHPMRETEVAIFAKAKAINQFLANFSFSLYLIHFPVMLFMLTLIYSLVGIEGIRTGFSPTDGVGLALYLSLIVTILLIAWLFAQATERQTYRLRSWLMRLTDQQGNSRFQA